MINFLRYIYTILIIVIPFIASADIHNINIDNVDTCNIDKSEKWYKQIRKFKNVENDSILTDSLKQVFGHNYWKWALMSGNLDTKDKSIIYPGFVGFCVDVYNWVDETFNSFDSNYVEGTGKSWRVELKSDNWLDSYYLNMPNGMNVGMVSNVKSNIGATISLWGIGVGYTYNIDKLLGGEPLKHKKWDFQFGCALFSLDAFYSKNVGTTNLIRLGNYSYNNIFNYDYRFSGLTLESYGVSLYYFFNNKRYSQSAAYSCSKYQKKSSGSIISGISISRHDLDLDFNSLPNDKLMYIPKNMRSYNIKYNDYCVMIGYGYNWVFRKNWLFNITAIPCFGFNHSLNDTQLDNKNMLSVDILAKMALVYNHNNFFYSIKGKLNGYFFNGIRYDFLNTCNNLSLTIGYRF